MEDRFKRILPGYSTRGIYLDDGDLYVNTYSGILKNGVSIFKKPDFGDGEIKKFRDSLYVVAWGGLVRYAPVTGAYEYLRFERDSGFYHDPIPWYALDLSLIRDTIWVGTSDGLGYLEGDSVIMLTDYPYIEDVVHVDGRMLIAADKEKGGVYERRGNQLLKLDLPDFNCFQILYSDGSYFLATDRGVGIWDGQESISFLTEMDGLSSYLTYTLAMDEYGFLWVSTFSGLNRININSGVITRYLSNIEFNRHSILHQDEKIYMGSMQGIFVFEPKAFLEDDVFLGAPWNMMQIISFPLLGLLLIFLGVFYWYSRISHQKMQRKETQLLETKKELFLMQIEQMVFNSDIQITVSNLADMLGQGERTLYRTFESFNLTPGFFLKELKLKKAKYLLDRKDANLSLREVAQQVGYTERYLIKLLNKKYGKNGMGVT